MNWELFVAFCGTTTILGLIQGPAVGAITATGLAMARARQWPLFLADVPIHS